MEKLQFEFVLKSCEDPKTNVLCITSITDINNHTFLIPDHIQPVKHHDLIMKTEIYKKIKNTLQRRHEKRRVWLSVTQEINDVYRDKDGNMQFKEYLLEETIPETHKSQTSGISEDTINKLLENFSYMKTESKSYNLKNLYEKFVLEKFTKKNTNVSQWMTFFENECARLYIEEDIKKIELFRLFLEDSCLDWYSSMLIKYTINSDWTVWKQNFCATFADKGWSPVRYAILFKYRQGSLLEYALKKERLLLEINKFMDTSTLIDLITTGLPNYIADKIDRNSLKESQDLFNNIRSLEHLINKNNTDKKLGGSEFKVKEKGGREKPCRICERENKGNRYHPETLCWFKNKNNDRTKKEQIRTVNNSELEIELNEMDLKN